MVGRKDARKYTDRKRDLQEGDLRHLEQAALVYDRLATEANWRTIECWDAVKLALRPPDEIHVEVISAVETLLPATKEP